MVLETLGFDPWPRHRKPIFCISIRNNFVLAPMRSLNNTTIYKCIPPVSQVAPIPKVVSIWLNDRPWYERVIQFNLLAWSWMALSVCRWTFSPLENGFLERFHNLIKLKCICTGLLCVYWYSHLFYNRACFMRIWMSAKFGLLPLTVFTKSCLFSIPWDTICLERPQNLAIA